MAGPKGERVPSRREQREARRQEREQEVRSQRQRARVRRWAWRIAVGGGVLAALVGAGYWAMAPAGRRGAQVGDHWHATYEVIICGILRPKLPATPGGIHTHGDGVIHVHPQTAAEARANANLGRFFRSAGLPFAPSSFSGSSIQLLGDRPYQNGDPCPDGRPGILRLLVNGRAEPAMDRYIIQDGDEIRLEFGPE